MSATVKITKQGFLIVEKCVEMYQVLDSTVPWKPIAETIKVLDKYYDQYTIASAEIVGKIKTLASNAADSYFMAKQLIFEMCSVAPRLIVAYKMLFDKHDPSNFQAQKQLLLKVLDDGMEKMSAAHVNMGECTTSFDLAVKELTMLHAQLTLDFGNGSEYVKSVNGKIRRKAYGTAGVGAVFGPFGLILSEAIAATIVEGRIIPDMQSTFDKIKKFYESVKVQIENASADIKNARNKLDLDIEVIRLQNSAISGQSQPSGSLDMKELHSEIIDSVNGFLRRCEEFKNKYN